MTSRLVSEFGVMISLFGFCLLSAFKIVRFHFLPWCLSVYALPIVLIHKQHQEDDGEQKNSSHSSSSSSSSGQRSLDEEQYGRHFSLAGIKLATHDFDDAFVIGKGGFGKVYKGMIDFEEEGIDVAIKRMNLDSSQGETEFVAEIEMLSKFRQSHHLSTRIP